MQQLTIEEIPFEEIQLNAHGLRNSRSSVGDISTLTASIEENGLIDPMVIWRPTEGTNVLLAGYRRHAALQQIRENNPAAFNTLNVSVFEGSLEEALGKNLEENIQRQNLNPADEAEAVCRLYEKLGDQKEVAAIIGMSQPWVSQRLNLFRGLIPQALECLRGGVINLTVARKISRMLLQDGNPDEGAQLIALEKIQGDTADEIEAGEGRARAKTYRTKREVDELELFVSQIDDDIAVDEQHLDSVKAVISWFRCQVDSEDLLFNMEEILAEDDLTDENIVSVTGGEAQTVKRRIRAEA